MDTLSALADLVRSGADVESTAESVVALAKSDLECDFAGITILRADGSLESLAVTDAVVEQCDRLQYELREGPCVDATWDRDDFTVPDVAGDGRWPHWGPRAAEWGVSSMLAARLLSQGRMPSSLNLYSSRPRSFADGQVAFAHVFAQHAAAALRSARRVEELLTAVDGRTLIGQAQGIVMERYGLSPHQAFAVLRRCSQDANLRLRVIAEELVRTGKLHDRGDVDSASPAYPVS